MPKRPHLGRAGAGALVVLAVLATYQAAGTSHSTPVSTQPEAVINVGRPGADPHEGAHRAPVPAGATVQQAIAAGPAAVIPPGRAAVRVPILMYHYIRINPDPRDGLGFNLSVAPEDFRAQMDWLAANAYQPINFDDLRGYLQGRHGLPPRPVILTFDDGYRDIYTAAFPVLKAHRFKAVAYIVSGFIGSPSSVSAEQVQEMDLNGIQIGSHTVSHADLTKTSAQELGRQLQESKASLEALVGHPVLDFCYPSGAVTPRVAAAVAAAGYQTATTTAPGNVHSQTDRFLWGRVRVGGGERLDRFAADLAAVEPDVMASGVLLPDLAPRTPRPKMVFPLTYPQSGPGTALPVEGLLP